MNTNVRSMILVSAVVCFALNAPAGLLEQLGAVISPTNRATESSVAALPESQVVGGLKEALGNGVTHAVNKLGHSNGFLTNLDVKIPMPGKLQRVEQGLRLAGQGRMADEFIASMNHAAEKAVPAAAGVFGDAIKQMSIADAKGILSGPDDAATQYFHKTTRTNLFTRFYPIVQNSTDQVGVTQKYKQMMGKFASVNALGNLFGATAPAGLKAADIDTYVTDKALDGLFKTVAEEEKNIRANPAARTTDLLKSVFGSATE